MAIGAHEFPNLAYNVIKKPEGAEVQIHVFLR
jgi:hypothetical protein